MPDLRPGNLKDSDHEDYGEFEGSLAQTIEEELDQLLELDGLPTLPAPPSHDVSDREVRDRRRFIIAIARGVVRHLAENPDAIVVTFDGSDHHVTINADQL